MTVVITGGRGAGKTYAAVQWLLADPENRVILTTSKQRARDIRDQYKLAERQVISAQGKLSPPHALKGRSVQVAIDNLDDFLSRVFQPFTVNMVTLTGEGDHLVPRENMA